MGVSLWMSASRPGQPPARCRGARVPRAWARGAAHYAGRGGVGATPWLDSIFGPIPSLVGRRWRGAPDEGSGPEEVAEARLRTGPWLPNPLPNPSPGGRGPQDSGRALVRGEALA